MEGCGESEGKGNHIAGILLQLKDSNGPAIVRVGKMPGHTLASWLDRETDDIVVTRERRQHYLERHPEMEVYEWQLIKALLDPSEIHANTNDSRMAIIYDPINEMIYLRVSVWISDRADRQNSVLNMRLGRMRELQNGRINGRVRWKK